MTATTLLALDPINPPAIAYRPLLPILVMLGVACVGVMVEAFVPAQFRLRAQFAVAGLGMAGTVAAIIAAIGHTAVTAAGAVVIDNPALFLQATLVILGFLCVLLVADRWSKPEHAMQERTEIFPLIIFALAGMMLFVAAGDLLMMFVALEVFSLPLYLLCGLARKRRLLSQESAVKYFLLGAFASAFFLYGLALIYGFAGTVSLSGIKTAVATSQRPETSLVIGVALLCVGLLFKAGVVPFHSWTPDVYQGAPTPITALMAACTKIAAFGAILRVFSVALIDVKWDLRPVLLGIAILTMLVGAVMSLTQTDVKRLLAYSSVANAGFLLLGALSLTSKKSTGHHSGLLGLAQPAIASTLFYLVAYGVVVIGIFAGITLIRDSSGEVTGLAKWAGLSQHSRVLSAVVTIFLLALAGIPLTSGFTSKFAIFATALNVGATGAVIVGVVASALLAFPYLRIIVMMYLSKPAQDGPTVIVPGLLTATVITVSAVITIVLGIAPQILFDVVSEAGSFTIG